MAILLLTGIAFSAVVLIAGAAIALCPSRSRTALWLCVGIPCVMVTIGGTVASIAGFRDPHSGSSYINPQLRLLVMACFVGGAFAAGLLLLLLNRKQGPTSGSPKPASTQSRRSRLKKF